MKTRREQIYELLTAEPMTPRALALELDSTPSAVLEDIEHVAMSLDASDVELLVAPPTCKDCGFDEFDDPLNLPSRCPDCRSESLEEPLVTIE